MKVNIRLKFFLSLIGIAGVACISPFASSYSSQSNDINFKSNSSAVPKSTLTATTDVSQFGVGVAPTAKNMMATDKSDQYFDSKLQETPLQFGYTDPTWGNAATGSSFPLSLPGAGGGVSSAGGQVIYPESGDPYTTDDAKTVGNSFPTKTLPTPYQYVNGKTWTPSTAQIVDMTPVTTLKYTGVPVSSNNTNIFMKNPVLGAFNIATDTEVMHTENAMWPGNTIPTGDTDFTTTNGTWTTPGDWPNASSNPYDDSWILTNPGFRKKTAGTNSLNLSIPSFPYKIADGKNATCYDDFRKYSTLNTGNIFPTQLDFLSEDTLNYAARYNAMAGFTNTTTDAAKILKAEAANYNAPTFYKPTDDSTVQRNLPAEYNTLRNVTDIDITDNSKELSEIGFNCFGGQYRYTGYYGTADKAPYFNDKWDTAKLKHSFTSPLAGSSADAHGYDIPDAFVALDEIKIDVPQITRIHTGAFYGGQSTEDKTSSTTRNNGRTSLKSIDLSHCLIAYMDDYNGISKADNSDASKAYWSTHCPDPDFSPTDDETSPDYIGGIFENNPNLTTVIFNSNIEHNSLQDIPSRCFAGDTSLAGIQYNLDSDNGTPAHTVTDQLPNSVKYIGAEPWKGCKAWTHLVLPNNPDLTMDANFLGALTDNSGPKTITFTTKGMTITQIGNMTDWNKALKDGQKYKFTIPYEGQNDISLSPYYQYFKTKISKGDNINIQYNIPTYKITGSHHNISPDCIENDVAHTGTAFFTVEQQGSEGCPAYLNKLTPQFCNADGTAINNPSGWHLKLNAPPTPGAAPITIDISADAGAATITDPVYVRAAFVESPDFFAQDETVFEELASYGSWKDSPGFSQNFWSAGTPTVTSSTNRVITFNNEYDSQESYPTITPSIKSKATGTPPDDGHWKPIGINDSFKPTTGTSVDASDYFDADGFPNVSTHTDTHSSGETDLTIGIDPNRGTKPCPGVYTFNVEWVYTADTKITVDDKNLYTLCCWSTKSLSLSSTTTSQSVYASEEQLENGYSVPTSSLANAIPAITFDAPAGLKLPTDAKQIEYGVPTFTFAAPGEAPQTWDPTGKWLIYGVVDSSNDPKSYKFSFDTSKKFYKADVGTYTFTLAPHPKNYNTDLVATPITYTFNLYQLTGFLWDDIGSTNWNADPNNNVRELNNTAYDGSDNELVWDTKDVNGNIYDDTTYTVTAVDQNGKSATFPTPKTKDGKLTVTWTNAKITPGSYTVSVVAKNINRWPSLQLSDSFVFNVWGLSGGKLTNGPDAFLKGKVFSSGYDSSDIAGLSASLAENAYTTDVGITGSAGSVLDPLATNVHVSYSLAQTPNIPVFDLDASQANKDNGFKAVLHWNDDVPNPFTETASYTPTLTITTTGGYETKTDKPSAATKVTFVDSTTATVDDSLARTTWNSAGQYYYSGQQMPNKNFNFKAMVGNNHDITEDSTWKLVDDTDYTNVPNNPQLDTLYDLVESGPNAGTVTFGTAPDLVDTTHQEYTFHMEYVYNNDNHIKGNESQQGTANSYEFHLIIDTAGKFSTDWTDNLFKTVDKSPTVFAQANSPQSTHLWHIKAPADETTDPNIAKYGYAIYGANNKLISYYGHKPNGYTQTSAFSGSDSGLVVSNILGAPDTQNAYLDNYGIDVGKPEWAQFINSGRIGFTIQVLGINAAGDQIASTTTPNLSYIDLSQISSLNKVSFPSTKYTVKLGDTKIVQTNAPKYDITCDKALFQLSTDRTKPSFFVSASDNSNDISSSLRILRNGDEISADTLREKYPKLLIYLSSTISDSTNYGRINFGFTSKLSSSENSLYSGSWIVYSSLNYQQHASGSTQVVPLTVESNGVEFDLTPPSKTGIIVGLIVGGVSATVILALVIHAIIKTSKIKKIEKEDAEEERAARARISGVSQPLQKPSSATGF